MSNPAIEASRQQWRVHFAAGNRFDIPYNLDELMTPSKAAGQTTVGVAIAVLNPIVAGIAALGAYGVSEELAAASNYFGNPPVNPALGISGSGLHLPTLPVLPWEQIAAVIISNQQGATSQARNGHILESAPFGNESTVHLGEGHLTTMSVIVSDAHFVRSLVSSPAYTEVVSVLTTPTGRAIGSIPVHLDPYLGPEQMIEFLFMLKLLTDDRGLKVYQVANPIEAIIRADEIRKVN